MRKTLLGVLVLSVGAFALGFSEPKPPTKITPPTQDTGELKSASKYCCDFGKQSNELKWQFEDPKQPMWHFKDATAPLPMTVVGRGAWNENTPASINKPEAGRTAVLRSYSNKNYIEFTLKGFFDFDGKQKIYFDPKTKKFTKIVNEGDFKTDVSKYRFKYNEKESINYWKLYLSGDKIYGKKRYTVGWFEEANAWFDRYNQKYHCDLIRSGYYFFAPSKGYFESPKKSLNELLSVSTTRRDLSSKNVGYHEEDHTCCLGETARAGAVGVYSYKKSNTEVMICVAIDAFGIGKITKSSGADYTEGAVERYWKNTPLYTSGGGTAFRDKVSVKVLRGKVNKFFTVYSACVPMVYDTNY